MGRFIQDGTGVVVSVADSKDERFALGWKPYDGSEPAAKSETPDKSWKVAELKAYADEHTVDLGDATKKEDLLAAIELHNESVENV